MTLILLKENMIPLFLRLHLASLWTLDSHKMLEKLVNNFTHWIAMMHITLVVEPCITRSIILAMKWFQFFVPKGKIMSLTSAHDMFDNWLQDMKLACHWWRVPENIHRDIPDSAHIELGLNFTKFGTQMAMQQL